MTKSTSPSFLHDLDFDYQPHGDGLRGTVTIRPEMLAPESDQASISVIASVADVITGIPLSARSDGQFALTVDLTTRILVPFGVGTYETTSTVIKRGRTISVAEATVERDGTTIAHSWATFMPIPASMKLPISEQRIGGAAQLDAPFFESLGISSDAPGVASVDHHPYVLQPSGTIQGGVICALAEAAGQSLLGYPITDLDLRYLAAVRIGPGRAVAELLDDRTARIVVTDAGAETDRPTAVGIARATPLT